MKEQKWTNKKQNVKLVKNHEFQQITYNVKYGFMLISFFLQAITQTNDNCYQACKNMFKVNNKITRKRCRSKRGKVILKRFLKNWQNPWKLPVKEFIFSKVFGCRLRACSFTKRELFTHSFIRKYLSVKTHII